MTHHEIEQTILTTDWSQYETAYGNAAQDIPYYVTAGDGREFIPKVSQSLLDLFSGHRQAAMKATHDLWCGLCHQHTFISSAALPAYDILFYGLQHLEEDLKIELLDIFYGFAVCSSRENAPGSWQGQLRTKLAADMPYFQSLTVHSNEDIAGFSANILEALS